MGSLVSAEICELVGLFILNRLSILVNKNDVGLYRADGLLIVHNTNGRFIDKKRKEIIKCFKDIGFPIDIEKNSKVANFLDITLDLNTNTYRPFKKQNNTLLYINTSFNHPKEIIKQLPLSVNDRLSNNLPKQEVFDCSKEEYEVALKRSGFKNTTLSFKIPTPPKRKNRNRNIIWFNPPFNKDVSTNIGKKILSLISKHFPPSNKLHKIFNRNTVKVSYS